MAFLIHSPLLFPRLSSPNPLHSRSLQHRPSTPSMSLLLTFSPSDFELQRIVGQQGYATITDWEYFGPRPPLSPTRTVQPTAPSIRLYEARITSSFPRLYNARVLLKEFLPDALELAVTEAEAYNILYENDRTGIDPDVVPVATLLGTFQTDQSFERAGFAESWRKRFPNSPTPPVSGAPFLVFRWEGMQTGLSCATGKGNDGDPGTQFFNRWFPDNLMKRKVGYLRAFMRRAVEALLYLHATGGIVHRAVGLASIMVNTVEYRMASSLQVKIRDLGFAKPVSGLLGEGDLEKARRAGAVSPSEIVNFYFADDVYALGYAFLEVVFSVFSGKPVTQDKLKGLFEDTFKLDIEGFRGYCAEDPEWSDAVAMLDERERSGWDLIKAMLSAKEQLSIVSLQQLSQSPFLKEYA